MQFADARVRPSVLRVGTIFHSYNLIKWRRCVRIEFMEKCSFRTHRQKRTPEMGFFHSDERQFEQMISARCDSIKLYLN